MKITLEYINLGGVGQVRATDAVSGVEINEKDLTEPELHYYKEMKQVFREQMSVLDYKARKSMKIPVSKLEIDLELKDNEK